MVCIPELVGAAPVLRGTTHRVGSHTRVGKQKVLFICLLFVWPDVVDMMSNESCG
jgi:hypothetical protein